jgi:carboxyl-terminal processing protease
MRENSGGFLTQAVKVSGLFMSSGVVVISKYAHGMTQYLRELDGRSYYSGPLVLLTSRGSASATEIVAQALQDYGLAMIVGDDRTYGKGTIQYQTVTDPRATNFFKVTIGRYYTVSGRTTQIEGVKADIVAPTIYSALPIGERYLEFPLRSDRIPSAYTDPLVDVEPRNREWFQKNYIPTLQKKLSVWTQMLPQLKANSADRIAHSQEYTLFLKTLSENKSSLLELKQQGDLQMAEAVHIVKDMNVLQPAARAQAALLLTQ